MQLCPDAAAEAPHTGSGKERKMTGFTREKPNWTLSRCGALINNVYCGSFEIARRLREGRGKRYRSVP